MIKVVPFGERMLVKLLPKEDVIGTLVLPDIASQRSWMAEVLSCGEQVKNFKAGDTILLSFYTGIVINLYENHWLDTRVRMIMESEVLGLAEKVEVKDGELGVPGI